MEKYRLSITLGDKSYVCNNINDEDIITLKNLQARKILYTILKRINHRLKR